MMRSFTVRILTIGAMALGAALTACRGERLQLSERIARHAQRGVGGAMRLDEATSFAWDSVRILGPYDAPSSAADSASALWRAAAGTDIRSRDDIDVLVFFHGEKVVQVVEHPRWLTDFDSSAVRRSYTRSDAVFAARRAPGDSAVTLSRASGVPTGN